MDNLYKALIQKQEELEVLIKQLKIFTSNVPEGRLRISHCKSIPQYYRCLNDENGQVGHYIRKEDRKLAHELAQKDYDFALLSEAEITLKNVKMLLKHYHPNKLQEIYEKLNLCRKNLIHPRLISNEEFAKEWSRKEYKHKQFAEGAAEIYTERGERVRSKSEKIIADMLNKREILYKYECPIELKEVGLIHPDFTIINQATRKEIYWEHLGMMDNSDYCENALRRIDAYIKNDILLGDRLLITYETAKHPLDTRIVARMIRSITE